MQHQEMGKLYVVATPIGNLKDITLRALETLQMVDQVIAEDTRHTALLLKHFSIQQTIISLHEFNERNRLADIIEILLAGKSLALVSDAGTPLISDPGFHLVREAQAQGITVVCVPGACAAIAALSVAGLPTDKFVFEGFLPVKSAARLERLQLLRNESRTIIFYEAPHRLLTVLQAMADVFGTTKKAVIARELTKVHESIWVASLGELINRFSSSPQALRGEIVLLLEGFDIKFNEGREVVPEQVLDILLATLPLKQAVMLTSQITNERKNVLYELALSKKGISHD